VGLQVILRNANTKKISRGEVELRFVISLFGGAAKPLSCLNVALRNTPSVGIEKSERGLCFDIALLGRKVRQPIALSFVACTKCSLCVLKRAQRQRLLPLSLLYAMPSVLQQIASRTGASVAPRVTSVYILHQPIRRRASPSCRGYYARQI